MDSLPIGTVTFLFTDIEGSTALWERQPTAMRQALAEHDAIVRQSIDQNQGRVFRTAGDAFFAAFAWAPQALAAAAQAQRNLYAASWPTEQPLRVRMAIHTGAAEVQQGDYVGASLNRIGRLLPAGHGGQTLLTQATEQLGRDNLPEGVRLVDLGEHRFRDLVYPERVYQLVLPGQPEYFPPLKTLNATPNNLPIQLTSFIGREKELAEIGKLLSGTRLLTLTGPGGTGKTRLSLQSGAAAIDRYPDGTWQVELASVTDPSHVPHALANALNLRDQPDQQALDLVTDTLRPKQMLLILDNCEHLIEACAQTADHLLRQCPDLKIMASSREALGISGEVSYRVPPLRLPEEDDPSDIDELGKIEAVDLFVKRAQAASPSFTLNHKNAHAVTQVCRRLDGIPLALELAAARIRLFSAEQIAAHLDDRFKLLTGGSRAALPRHQTLQATIDWSYDLLSEKEKVLLRRLSVFAGGWSYEAAEAVCSGEAENGQTLDSFEIMDLLAQLINKSLVLADERDEAARYRFLETVRQYASQKLVSSGEAAKIRDRHMIFFSEQAYRTGRPDLYFFSKDTEEIHWLEREQDNLRLAEEWAIEHNPEQAMQITTVYPYWVHRGLAVGKLQHLRRVRETFESTSELSKMDPHRYQELLSLSWMAEGSTLMAEGRYPDAIRALTNGFDLADGIGAEQIMGVTLGQISVAYSLINKPDEATVTIQKGISLAHQMGDRTLLGMFLISQARITYYQQGYQLACQQLNQAYRDVAVDGDSYGQAFVRMTQGMLAVMAMRLDEAQRYSEESYRLFEINGNNRFMNVCRGNLADVARLTGDYPKAIGLYLETISTWMVLANRGAVARCLECLGSISLRQAAEAPEKNKMLERAANLFGAAEAIRLAAHMEMPPDEKQEYDGWIEELRSLLDAEAFSAAWSIGSGMGLERAVAFAGQA